MVDPNLFNPGAQVVLEAPLATLPRAVSVIRGLHPQRYIIIDPPLGKGREVRFEAGMELLVRLLKAQKILTFTSKCLGRSLAPEALLFLEYPLAVEYGQIRKGKNFQVFFDAAVRTLPGQAGQERAELCKILSISSDGCLLQAEASLPFGAKLCLGFTLPEIGPVRDMVATVKSCQAGKPAWLLEVVFDLENDEGLRQVRDYLSLLDQRQLDDAMLRLSSLD